LRRLCAFTWDFTDPAAFVREKELKRTTLLELVDYVNNGSGKFTEAVSDDIAFMLSNNLFRGLPPARSHDPDNFDPEEEEPSLEPAWAHLQVRDSQGLFRERRLTNEPACFADSVRVPAALRGLQ
jgi:serine/threonine-protein phosphatase 2A regulatory subunit B'